MDCDDNDLRSQNFQLAIDDENRFHQSLQGFTLPKFDFDDHLQIQLQYGNLTAPEGLLGIQGQADNWIEEFSPRHSAIEFSSSAAESRSISRHNHVWSVDTSSESVETLLQFVNDDEMVNDKTMDNFAEKVTCDASSILENIENHQAVPTDDCQNSLLGSNVLVLKTQDGGTSQKFEVENLEIESSSDLDEKLNCSGNIITEACICNNNLESITDVGATECLDDHFRSDDHRDDGILEKLLAYSTDGGTSQKFEVENLEIESSSDLDEKLNCSGKIITEARISNNNLESVTDVGATECLDDQFQSDDHRDDGTRAKLLAYSTDGGTSQKFEVKNSEIESCSDLDEKLNCSGKIITEACISNNNLESVTDVGATECLDDQFQSDDHRDDGTRAKLLAYSTDGGTSQKFEVKNSEIESCSDLDEKLNCSGKIITEACISNNNLESVTDVGATECLDDQFQSDDHRDDGTRAKLLAYSTDRGTSQKFEVENLEIESSSDLDEKLNCSGKIITEACISNNLESVTDVGATECLDDQFQSDDHRDDGTRAKLLAYSTNGGTSQKFEVENLEIESSSDLDEKLNCSGKIITEACISNNNLESVTNVGATECLDDQFQSDDHRDDGTRAKLLAYSTQGGLSAASINNTSTSSGNINKGSFSKQVVEVHDEIGMNAQLETIQVSDEPKEMFQVLLEGQVNQQFFEGHATTHKDICNCTDSSSFEVSSVSVTMLNKDSCDSSFPQHSDSLLQVVTCQVYAVNNDSMMTDKTLTCTKELSSAAVGDEGAKRNHVEVGEEYACDLTNKKGNTNDFGESMQEYLQEDNLDGHILSTEENKMTRYAVEHAVSEALTTDGQEANKFLSDKSSMDTNSCITEKPVDGDVTEINDDISMVCDSCIKKNTSRDDATGNSDKPNIELGSLGHSAVENSPDFVNDEHIRTSFTTQGKLIHISDSDKVCEWNDNNLITIGPFTRDNTTSSLNLCSTSSDNNSLAVMDKITSCSVAQPALVKDEQLIEKSCPEKEVEGPASVDTPSDFAAGQQLAELPCTAVNAEEKEATPVASLPLSGCIENNISMSLEVCSRTLTSSELLVMPVAAICDSSAKNSLNEKGETIIIAEFCAAAVDSEHGTITSAHHPEEANLVPEEAFDKEKISETDTNASDDSPNSYSRGLAPRSKTESTNLTNPESGSKSSFATYCGSPTVISCNEPSKSGCDFQAGIFDQPFPTSSSPKNMDQNKGTLSDKIDHSTLEAGRTFTLEVQSVVNVSQKDTGKDWKPLPIEHSPELPQKSVTSQDNSIGKASKEDKKTHAIKSEGKKVGILKGEDKIKSREKQAKGRRRNLSSKSLTSDGTIISKTQVIQQHPCPESSNTKTPSSLPIKSSNLSDLSCSSARLIHRPFTDLQQVQLRTQIFVYGSLIQGVPPDEAFMMSAFGGTDGGRNLWERSWRASHARFPLDKSPINSFEMPMRSIPGVIVTEEANNFNSSHGKSLNSPSGQNTNKVISSSVVDTAVSGSSPLWNKSSIDGLTSSIRRGCNLQYNQSISPLYACQPSQGRQSTSNDATWLPQSDQPPKCVFASPTSAPYSSIPVAETVQVTPLCQGSTVQLISPGDSLLSECPGNVSAAVVLPNEPQQSTAVVANTKNETTGQKSRRRKKATAPQELRPTLPAFQPQSEDTLIERTPHASFPLPANCTNAIASSPLVSASSESHFPSKFQIRGNADNQQSVLISDEMLIKMEQSKLEAENASAQAAVAVKYSQDVWTKLAAQRGLGLEPEVEEKLVSAAVAAAAAASVAKAAAEAANLSSKAALQAKMMADEALNAVQMGNFTQETEVSLDIGKLARLTHVSILKGKDNMDVSSSVISATREAARDRVKTASGATKRAENLDALFKAVELAALAVSQAGTIIALGDPLPFSICELTEAGPEDYWKAQQHAKGSLKDANEGPCHNEKEKVSTVNRMSISSEPSMRPDRNSEGNVSENTLRDASTDGLARIFSIERGHRSNIQKGSLVEIAAADDGLQGVWFPASVLDLKDGKAYACYKQTVSGEGQRKEWIPIEHHNDKAPRVRIAHPSTIAKSEGKRKRPRETLDNYAWAVGDMVDAWICESWWEGIITEKNLEDETNLTVHFPARGDTSVVRAWNLRPSLIWKDGKWLEWTQIRGRDTVEVHQGDTPIEKRQKIGQVEAEHIPHMKIGAKLISDTENTTDLRKLEVSSTLSEKDKIFSAIENAKEEKTITHRVKCTGLHKEGSGVIIGVPKPGKRRKFMEVSKHYISDKAEKVDQGGAMKFTKYSMPRASHSWKNNSRVDLKGKPQTNSRPKDLNSSRSQDVHASRIGRGNLSSTISSIENVGESGLTSSPSPTARGKEDFNSMKKPSAEADTFPSICEEAEFSIIEPSVPSFPIIASAKTNSSAASEETSGKGKDLLATDQSTGPENKGSGDHAKTAMKVVEPRRSSRRIQPTSRLLEGLQSSLIMSKIPSVSHDKGTKSMHRGISH